MNRMKIMVLVLSIAFSTFGVITYADASRGFENLKVEYSTNLSNSEKVILSTVVEGVSDDGLLSDGVYSNDKEIITTSKGTDMNDFLVLFLPGNNRTDDKAFHYLYISKIKTNRYLFLTASVTYSKGIKKSYYITNKVEFVIKNINGLPSISDYKYYLNDNYNTAKAFRLSKEGKAVLKYAKSIVGEEEGTHIVTYLRQNVYMGGE